MGPSGSAGRAPSCSLGLWWEVQPSARSPPLSLFVSDQEHLDEEINNLRKELRVKVNRLFEAQGKCCHSGTFCLCEQMLHVRRVQKLLSSGCSCSLSLTPSLLPLPLWSCHPPVGETGSTPCRGDPAPASRAVPALPAAPRQFTWQLHSLCHNILISLGVLPGKPELKGFNLNPMTAEEMKLINRILEG